MYGHSPFSSSSQRSTLYTKIGLETDILAASPHRLIAMLFEGAFSAMNQAASAIENGDIEQKTRALSRAVRIVDEGLGAGLNLEAGPLAHDLRELYAYTCRRLMQANLHNDLAAIDDCRRVLGPLRDAWAAIASSPAALVAEGQRAA
jgi:flagellar protein FliS